MVSLPAVASDCGLLPLPMQMVKIVCGLVTILMQQHTCSESSSGCLLLTVLLKLFCCLTQCIKSIWIGRIGNVGLVSI